MDVMIARVSETHRMARSFSHSLSSPVLFGVGVSLTLAEKSLLKKCARIAVVSDAGVVKAGLTAAIVAPFGDRIVFIDSSAVQDADTGHVDAAAARARSENVDAILAIGGGSVIDTAKGIAMGLAKNAPVATFEGIATVRMKTVPVVCVPTTAGTGSEATQFCVLKDKEAQKKRIYADQSLVPALAVLDPALVVGLPRTVTCATAVDALTHAIEALASKMRNPMGTALALEAVRLLVTERALERSLLDPTDTEARGDCLIAANLAGQAVTTSMLGACHALAHVVGAHGGVVHGVANGLFLTDVMTKNVAKAGDAYLRLARSLNVASVSDDVAALISVVDHFVFDIAGTPRRLRDAAPGLAELLPRLAKDAAADPDLPTNPVALDENALLNILQQRW